MFGISLNTSLVPWSTELKIVVGSNSAEMEKLESLMQNGKKNSVVRLQMLSSKEVRQREPIIHAEGGLSVPSTGIIDSHGFMHKLEYLIKSSESTIIYNTEVNDISSEDDYYILSFKDIDYYVKTKIVVNSAGLWCDEVSKMVGINDYKLHICKGEYYKTHTRECNGN